MLIIRTIMKREIKFRGKEFETRQWIEGSLITYPKHYPNIILVEDAEPIPRKTTYVVLPETVCQFSEITDKNGNSIFEHDLILIHDSESSYQFTVEVLFHKGMFCYKNKACGFTPLWYVSDRCEVIGNVFDNPELLKGSKQ
jgi:uncharacterized phage protein (TIGR01671 family)